MGHHCKHNDCNHGCNHKRDCCANRCDNHNLEKQLHIKELCRVCELDGKFLLVNVGNEERPATPEDIFQMEESLKALFAEHGVRCMFLVTHHAVSAKIVD